MFLQYVSLSILFRFHIIYVWKMIKTKTKKKKNIDFIVVVLLLCRMAKKTKTKTKIQNIDSVDLVILVPFQNSIIRIKIFFSLSCYNFFFLFFTSTTRNELILIDQDLLNLLVFFYQFFKFLKIMMLIIITYSDTRKINETKKISLISIFIVIQAVIVDCVMKNIKKKQKNTGNKIHVTHIQFDFQSLFFVNLLEYFFCVVLFCFCAKLRETKRKGKNLNLLFRLIFQQIFFLSTLPFMIHYLKVQSLWIMRYRISGKKPNGQPK